MIVKHRSWQSAQVLAADLRWSKDLGQDPRKIFLTHSVSQCISFHAPQCQCQCPRGIWLRLWRTPKWSHLLCSYFSCTDSGFSPTIQNTNACVCVRAHIYPPCALDGHSTERRTRHLQYLPRVWKTLNRHLNEWFSNEQKHEWVNNKYVIQ